MSNNEIDIYGYIDDVTIEGMSISPQFVKDKLKELNNEKEIVVNINSNGGDVFSGVAIYNMLQRHSAKIIVNIDGIAASIASVIAMAGDVVNMPRNGMMMIHNAWTLAQGDSNAFKKQAESLERINSVVVNSYLEKNPDIDHALLRQYMDEETWFSANEAKEFGLIDNVTERTKVAAATTSTMLGGEKIMAKYRDEGASEPQTQNITVEDVMDKLDEILEAVKNIDSKKLGVYELSLLQKIFDNRFTESERNQISATFTQLKQLVLHPYEQDDEYNQLAYEYNILRQIGMANNGSVITKDDDGHVVIKSLADRYNEQLNYAKSQKSATMR